MHMQTKLISRYWLLACAALLLPLTATQALAGTNPSATGTLTVTATVTSSIQLEFNTGSGGVTLTGANTNAATLAFGPLSAYGTAPSNVTISNSSTLCSNCFVASTPISLIVNQADGSSSNFTLTAYASAPTSGEVLAVGSSGALSTSSGTPTTITSTGSYGSGGNTLPVYLGIPTATGNNTGLSDTINFVATAN